MAVVVKPNENLTGISEHHLGGFDDRVAMRIRQLNPKLTDLNHIEVGQVLLLPQQLEDREWPQTMKPQEEIGQRSNPRRGVQ